MKISSLSWGFLFCLCLVFLPISNYAAAKPLKKAPAKTSPAQKFVPTKKVAPAPAEEDLPLDHHDEGSYVLPEIPKTKIVLNSTIINPVRNGVIVLGMHRSGTSLLGGLLNSTGLKLGAPLVPNAGDNMKGYFERADVNHQNNMLLGAQGLNYSYGTCRFDYIHAMKRILINYNDTFFREGRRALYYFNNPQNAPWMLKDPRLSITLRAWLPFLRPLPAILFTYRHPFDVALSMNRREFEHFPISKGLRIWYVYTRRGIENSNDLCRVITSNKLLLQQPMLEMARLEGELSLCGVHFPHSAEEATVMKFLDSDLQHGRTTFMGDALCEKTTDFFQLSLPDIWEGLNLTSHVSVSRHSHHEHSKHLLLYQEVLRVYCAMESRAAFQRNFKWDYSITDF